jgi:hypothetical protein
MEIQGKVLEIGETVDVSDRFRKRELIVEYIDNPQYPEYLKFELVQDKCELIDGFNVGDELVVHFDLKGRRWTDKQGQVKYFNSLQAWRLIGNQSGSPQPQDAPFPDVPPPVFNDEGIEDIDDIKF